MEPRQKYFRADVPIPINTKKRWKRKILLMERKGKQQEVTPAVDCDTAAHEATSGILQVGRNETCTNLIIFKETTSDVMTQYNNTHDMATGTAASHCQYWHDEGQDLFGKSQRSSSVDLTKEQLHMVIMAMKMKHNLTMDATVDILKLVNLVSANEEIGASKFLFEKFFNVTPPDYEFHHVCNICDTYIGQLIEPIRCISCNSLIDPKSKSKMQYFAYLPIENQLKILLEDGSIPEDAIFSPQPTDGSHIADITDGDLYKSRYNSGKTDKNGFMSLSISCDGVPIHKSSKFSMWPVFCLINELAPKQRQKKAILAAIWFGCKKPPMQVYFHPFIKEIKALSDIGFQFKIGNIMRKIQVFCLVCVCDSVGRPLVQNFLQCNGQYGCSLCYEKGTILKDRAGNARVYPYNAKYTLRTAEETKRIAIEVSTSGVPQKGIKGLSIFCTLDGFDVVRNFPPDYMHSVLLGVVRRTTNLWFNSKNSKMQFYLKPYEDDISTHLSNIKPPCNISRTPRPLSDRKFWKAHEWLTWLLYYSPVLLKPYLSNDLYVHWNLLVCSISMLMQPVTRQDVKIAHRNLVSFVIDYANFYGTHNMTFNVHLCLHLASSVNDWGPLWTHSAFIYEACQGELLNTIKSTQSIPQQICKAYFYKLRARLMASQHMENANEQCKDFLADLTWSKPALSSLKYSEKITLLFLKSKAPSKEELTAFEHVRVQSKMKLLTVARKVIINNEIFHSKDCTTEKKRISYIMGLDNNRMCSVQNYVYVEGKCFALIRYFSPVKYDLCSSDVFSHLHLKHIIPVNKMLGILCAIPIEKIKQKCILIVGESCDFIVNCVHQFEYVT